MKRLAMMVAAALPFGAVPAMAQGWRAAPDLPDGWVKRDMGAQGCAVVWMTPKRTFGYLKLREGDRVIEAVAFSPPESWPAGDTRVDFPASIVADGRELGTATLTRMPTGLWQLDPKWREESARHARLELRLTGVPGAEPRVVDMPPEERSRALELVKAC